MTVVLAPDFVINLVDRGLIHHDAAVEWVRTVDEDLVTTPLALDLIDIRMADRGVQRAVREDFARGAYTVRWWADALDETLAIARKHDDEFMLWRASLVALADRLRTDRIATFDPNWIDVKTPGGRTFVMLPERNP